MRVIIWHVPWWNKRIGVPRRNKWGCTYSCKAYTGSSVDISADKTIIDDSSTKHKLTDELRTPNTLQITGDILGNLLFNNIRSDGSNCEMACRTWYDGHVGCWLTLGWHSTEHNAKICNLSWPCNFACLRQQLLTLDGCLHKRGWDLHCANSLWWKQKYHFHHASPTLR